MPERALRVELSLPPAAALAALSGPSAPELAEALAGAGAEATGRVEVSALGDGRWLVRAPDHAVLCDALAAVPAPEPGAGDGRSPRRLSVPSGRGRRRRRPASPNYDGGVAIYAIRQYGDPVLTRPAKEVDEIDGKVATWSRT